MASGKVNGELSQPHARLGYIGWKSGQLFIGKREEGLMIECSGSRAEYVWRECYVKGCSVPRIDIQVTARLIERREEYRRTVRDEAILYNAHQQKAKQRKIRWTEDIDNGFTLYVGSRTSEYFLRIYDKEAESGSDFYKDCWRYEMEIHNKAAKSISDALFKDADRYGNNVMFCMKRFCSQRGILLDITVEEADLIVRPIKTPKSDVYAKLEWLYNQVRPTTMLLGRLGYGEVVRDILFKETYGFSGGQIEEV